MRTPGLKFDAGLHRYMLDGVLMTSVTTVTGAFYAGPKASEATLSMAAEQGTAIHHLTDLDERADSKPLTRLSQHAGSRAAALDWKRERRFRTEEVEVRLASKAWRTAGTADRIGVFTCPGYPETQPDWWIWPRVVRGIVDWKTGRVPDLCAAQLAAYRMMAAERGIVAPDCPIVAVALREDGSWWDCWYRGALPDALWFSAWTLYHYRPQSHRAMPGDEDEGYVRRDYAES